MRYGTRSLVHRLRELGVITLSTLLFASSAFAQDPFETLKEKLANSSVIYENDYSRVFNLGRSATPEMYLSGQLYTRRVALNFGEWGEGHKDEIRTTVPDLALPIYLRQHLNEALKRDPSLTWFERQKAITAFLKVIDLKGVSDGFSGFPYYTTVRDLFQKPETLGHLHAIADAVEAEARRAVIAVLAGDKNFVPRDFFSVLQEAYPAPLTHQIRLAGILMSRDISFSNYLKLLPNFAAQRQSLAKIAIIPVHVRMVNEADRYLNHIDYDRSSFAPGFSSNIRKNYYFWSGAYVTNELLLAGVPQKVINRMMGDFPVAYKSLRILHSKVGKTILTTALPAAVLLAVTGVVTHHGSETLGGMAGMLGSLYSAARYDGREVDWDIRQDTFQVARSTLKGGVFATQHSPCNLLMRGE